MIRAWYPLSFALNNINRGLGYADLYPFTLPQLVVGKLRYVHELVRRVADGSQEETGSTGSAPVQAREALVSAGPSYGVG